MQSSSRALPQAHRKWNWDTIGSWLYLAPAGALLLAFVFFPLAYVFYISLLRWNLISTPHWVGLGNYTALLGSPYFWQAVLNTLLLTLGTLVVTLPVAFLTALFLHGELSKRLAGFYQAAVLAPYVFPLVASGVAWNLFLQKDGIVNWALSLIHLHGPNWLASGIWPLISVILVTSWQFFGYYTLIFLAGLQGVPAELYEAAEVEGASGLQKIWRITLPLISPTLLFVIIILFLQGFQTFTQVYVMTQGGPNGATTTLVYYLYQEAFQFFNIGRAGAVSVMLLLVLLLATGIQLWASRRWVNYDQI
jgi:sn-glycerol 3-phosphate transport system permease protein